MNRPGFGSMVRAALPLAVLLAICTATAHAQDAQDARAVVQAATDEAVAILRDASLSQDQKRAKIEQIAYANFDFERMAKLALARSYRKLDEAQRVEFQKEFRRHLALTYGRSIAAYSDEGIEVGKPREHKNGDVTVPGTVVGGKNSGATVSLRMRKRDDTWKAIDVIVEGISLIANFRSQVQDIVKSKGPAALIAQLREKNDAKANPK